MPRSLRLNHMLVLASVSIGIAACHHAPAAPEPVMRTASNDDGARLARLRADSIARANAARQDSIARANARADSIRRAAEAMRTAENARTQLLAPVHFELDRTEILPSERTLLDQKASILASNRSLRLRIDGNGDERGSDEYNLALGMRRAVQTREYLAARGVDSTRITLSSNGEEHPVCADHDESCWTRNRRAEFVIVAGGDRISGVR